VKQVITKEDISKSIQDLAGQGRKPTLAAIHAALNNRGSMSTLVRLKAEIDAETQPETDSPEGLKAFREVWALAVDEGRRQQEAVLAELRESIKALASENERLEGTAVAAQNRATELERAKSQAETALHELRAQVDGELKQARAASAEASTQAADALQKLTKAQTAHAAETAALRAEAASAVAKAHELELQLVRATALLEAKGIRPTTPESRKPKHA
jgi:chromosome segregation ATPase